MNKNDGTHNKEIMAKGRLKSKPKIFAYKMRKKKKVNMLKNYKLKKLYK